MPICIEAINMADNRPRELLFVHYQIRYWIILDLSQPNQVRKEMGYPVHSYRNFFLLFSLIVLSYLLALFDIVIVLCSMMQNTKKEIQHGFVIQSIKLQLSIATFVHLRSQIFLTSPHLVYLYLLHVFFISYGSWTWEPERGNMDHKCSSVFFHITSFLDMQARSMNGDKSGITSFSLV